MLPLELSFEGAVQEGGKKRVEFGGGFSLQVLQSVHLRLQRVQFGHDPALLDEWWYGNNK